MFYIKCQCCVQTLGTLGDIKQVNLYNQILIQYKSLYHISYIKTEEILH